jgi:hypothetical protein
MAYNPSSTTLSAIPNALNMPQTSTPGTLPSSGFDLLYFKSDNNLYRLTSSGSESQVSGMTATWGSIVGTLSAQTDLQTALNAKQNSGNYITALTGDVTASGPGSVAATVASVGGSSAASVHAAAVLASTATSSNAPGTLVERDSISSSFAVNNIFVGTLSDLSDLEALSLTSRQLIANDGSTVNLDWSSPNQIAVSAGLQINTTVGGLGLPRLSTTQRNALVNPIIGLEIFNTTTGLIEANFTSAPVVATGNDEFPQPQVVYTAVTAGASGNSISVQTIDDGNGSSQFPTVVVTGNAIVLHVDGLLNDGITLVQDVINAINGDPNASLLITASLYPGAILTAQFGNFNTGNSNSGPVFLTGGISYPEWATVGAPNLFANNTLSNLVSPTAINENLNFNAGIFLSDTSGASGIDLNNRFLIATTNSNSIDWQNRFLINSSSINSIDWQNDLLNDGSGNVSLDWTNRFFKDSSGNEIIDYQNQQLKNSTGFAVIYFNSLTLQLVDNSNDVSIDWAARQLVDAGGIRSILWGSYELQAPNTATQWGLTSFTLLDNQVSPATIESWQLTFFTSINIDYSITRHGNSESGTLIVISNGTVASVTQQLATAGSSSGITFTVSVGGGNVNLQYTSTSTGFTGSMKYSLKKWLA